MTKTQLILLIVYASVILVSYALSIIAIAYRKKIIDRLDPKIKVEKFKVHKLKDAIDYRLVIRGKGNNVLNDNTYHSKSEAKKALKKNSEVLYKNGNTELTYEIIEVKVKR